MYKNNDEAIDWEVKRLLDDSIYIDTEQAYLAAEKNSTPDQGTSNATPD